MTFFLRGAHSPCEWKRSIFAMCANTYGRRRQIGLHLTPSKSSQWVPGPFPRDVKLIKLNYVTSRHSLQGGGYPPLSNQNGWLYPDNMDEASFHMHGFMSKYYQYPQQNENRTNWNGMRTSTNMFTHLKHLILYSFKYDMKQVINPFQMVKHLDPYLLPVFASTTIM